MSLTVWSLINNIFLSLVTLLDFNCCLLLIPPKRDWKERMELMKTCLKCNERGEDWVERKTESNPERRREGSSRINLMIFFFRFDTIPFFSDIKPHLLPSSHLCSLPICSLLIISIDFYIDMNKSFVDFNHKIHTHTQCKYIYIYAFWILSLWSSQERHSAQKWILSMFFI